MQDCAKRRREVLRWYYSTERRCALVHSGGDLSSQREKGRGSISKKTETVLSTLDGKFSMRNMGLSSTFTPGYKSKISPNGVISSTGLPDLRIGMMMADFQMGERLTSRSEKVKRCVMYWTCMWPRCFFYSEYWGSKTSSCKIYPTSWGTSHETDVSSVPRLCRGQAGTFDPSSRVYRGNSGN